jgi:hypothetical protein
VWTSEWRGAGPSDGGQHQRLTGEPAVAVAMAGNEAAMCMHTCAFCVHNGVMFPNIRTIRVDFAAETINFDPMFMVFKPMFMVLVPMFMVFKPMFMVLVPMFMVFKPMFMVFVPMFTNIDAVFADVTRVSGHGVAEHAFKRRPHHATHFPGVICIPLQPHRRMRSVESRMPEGSLMA